MSESVLNSIKQLLEIFDNSSESLLVDNYIRTVAQYDQSQIKHMEVMGLVSENEILLNATINIDKQIKVTNKTGIFCIKYVNKIIITKNGELNANGIGKYMDADFFSRAGGIIELSAETIINNGKITCDGRWSGSGGVIKINCHTFINRGVIKAKAGLAWRYGDDPGIYGTIHIQCSQYKNESTIFPLPDIINMPYHKNNDFKTVSNEFDEEDDFIVDQSNFYHIFYNEHNPLLGIHQYEIAGSLRINCDLQISKWDAENRTNGGILQIYVPHTLIIEKHVEINAEFVGYFGEYGIGKGQRIGSFNCGGGYGTEGEGNSYVIGGGISYGNEELTTLYLGSGTRGNNMYRAGGIIELVAMKIVNNGEIMCNGEYGCSGGSIKIRCKTFVNKGIIYAKSRGAKKNRNVGAGGSGRIAIFCEQFENEKVDSIAPIPYVNNETYEYDKDVKHFKFTDILI